MTDKLVFAIAQLNPVVGDIAGNKKKLLNAYNKAEAAGADIVLASECYLTGYQLDDLLLVDGFMDQCEAAIEGLAEQTKRGNAALIFGAPRRDEVSQGGAIFRNSVYILDGGKVIAIRDKARLPIGGVFDDPRNFTAGALSGPVMVRGVLMGLPICEDMWHADVIECMAETGAEMLIAFNGSPYEQGKGDERIQTAVSRVVECGLPIIYINLVGGQDDVVFDGGSFALNLGGDLACSLPNFNSSVSFLEAKRSAEGWRFQGTITKPDEGEEAVWRCLSLGIRDYVEKNGFDRVILGLSGGIDSALVACLAVDALGADRVDAVMMPSPYTSTVSLEDAAVLARNLGISLRDHNIGPSMEAADSILSDAFAEKSAHKDLAYENIQPRLRGMILMALSNAEGQLVLTTGNKSEYATGYATLYGDMCGGYAPLIDVWKTQVFALCRWRNKTLPKHALGGTGEIIPNRIITRPPSAELRLDQQDSDSLPPYEILDPIMQALVEDQFAPDRIIANGFDEDIVNTCVKMLKRAEYKRRQSAPGPKISRRAFYRDRRLPITSGYRHNQLREST